MTNEIKKHKARVIDHGDNATMEMDFTITCHECGCTRCNIHMDWSGDSKGDTAWSDGYSIRCPNCEELQHFEPGC